MRFYLDACLARGQSPRTIETKQSALSFFIAWCLANKIKSPQKIDLNALEAYLQSLMKYRQPYKNKPLEPASIRNRLTAVKMFLKVLYQHSIIRENPAALFDLPRVPRRLPKGFLEVSEIEKLLGQALLSSKHGLRDRAILEVYYATGIRRMDLANLNIADVDLRHKVITINRGKGQKDRRVPMADRTVTWIIAYLQQVRPLLAKVESQSVLFLDDRGLKFRAHQLTRLARKYVQRAGIKKPGACNLFRHSTATLMHENGADIRHVQEMLGHADISTTQVYTHVTITKLREIYKETHPAARLT